ncbi:PASTA domain-containing protein [Arthrobacter silvisoli]|uniref:PASTA domain-containing protein n=1 Tax=Arthrobacter silvisoli TaxID=2291022 RepID=UPI000E213377|nr:PASTA domain-containing protein [Arthrobacter silvisoli]
MGTITMTLSSPTVVLKDGKGSLTASVTNGTGASARVVLGAFPGGAAPETYTEIPDPLRTIAAGATEQYLATFDTAGAKPGSYPVKLIAYSADDAPEDYADQARVVTLEVPAPATPAPAPGFPWLWVIIGGVVLLAVVGAVLWFLFKDASVPPVVGKPQAEAVQILKDAGFGTSVTEKESTQAAGTVVGQEPEGGRTVGRGSTVALEVAVPVRTTVPAVLGATVESAKSQFAAAKIQLDFTASSTCTKSPELSLQRCVVLGVNPDVGTRVNLNALVLVRTELRSKIFIDNNTFPNLCKNSQCVKVGG